MSVWKRAWYHVIRKRKKSIILFFILFLIATALAGGMSVWRAVDLMKTEIRKSMKTGFLLENIEEDTMFDQSDAELIRKNPKISGYQYETKTVAKLADGKTVSQKDGIVVNEELLGEEKGKVSVNGSTDTSESAGFTGKRLKLKEGRHIDKKDRGSILVHEKAAKENGWNVGDKICLGTVDGTLSEELEIVGIFTGKAQGYTVVPADMAENTYYTDLESAQRLAGMEKEAEKKIASARFYVRDPKEAEAIKKEIQKLPLEWGNYKISDNKKEAANILALTDNMEKIIRMVIGAVIGISILILSLVLVFWVQGRMHETGILMSVGISKIQIVGQYILEILLIAVVSFILSYFSGKAVGDFVGDQVAVRAEDTQQNGAEGKEEMLDINVSWKEMGAVYALGAGIVVLSVGASSSVMLRLKPKEILSKMS